MLKALMKKQFLELNSFYFRNRKTGKNRSKAGTIGFIILYLLLFALLGIIFYGLGTLMYEPFTALGLDWLYFCMMGMFAIALGTFGSVFNTYAGLYHAKDNELLLSMPIPPMKILLVRMTGVYSMSLLYSALVWVPTMICYFVHGPVTISGTVFGIFQTFLISLFVTVLTCALGWVVALISSKLKNKTFVTVLSTLVFIGVYYFVYFRINTFLQSIVENAEMIGNKVKSVFYPFYLMGLASRGDVLPMLAVTAMVAALAVLTVFILSKSFIKITTTKESGKKTEYKQSKVKTESVKKALFRKELKRLMSSPTYLLNCGIGLVIMAAAAVALIIKANTLREYLTLVPLIMPGAEQLVPVFGCAIISLMISTNNITAPSVSLEGKSIWILQSLPVNIKDALNAKQSVHMAFNMPAAVLCVAAFSYVIKADITTAAYMLVYSLVYVLFMSSLGLALNLKMPNLSWTNETVPVKQGAPVVICIFGGWAVSAVFAAVGYLIFRKTNISLNSYILYYSIVLTVVSRYINRWIETKGAKIFSSL